MYLKCSDAASATTVSKYVDLMSNLGSASQVVVLTAEGAPEGCAIQTVSARCEVHMMLKVGQSATRSGQTPKRLSFIVKALK